MKLELVTLAVPLFFIGIALEAGLSRARRQDYYVLGDSLASVGTGVLDQLLVTLTRPLLFIGPYLWVYNHVAPWHFNEPTAAVCLGGLLLADFGYYWAHRLTHEHGFLWAGHAVHHQSEEYNLSTALRQNWFATWFLYCFNLPLALIGIGPLAAAVVIPIIQLYQFWIHTRFIGKLGPFEWVFNTPSHHRVHHGINPQYVDKNYGAILIVWDRLFGTFAKERDPVVYGVLKPLRSWNPAWAWIAPWRDLLSSGSLKAWWKPPGWDPKTGELPDVPALFREASVQRYHPRLGLAAQAVALLAFLVLLGASSLFLFLAPQLGFARQVPIAAGLIGVMSLFGAWIAARCQRRDRPTAAARSTPW